ncbi:hypothetical protein ABIB57_000860 [Devosia sp. UYZn731]
MTDIIVAASGNATPKEHVWVQIVEAPDGGWGIGGHAYLNDEIATEARRRLGIAQASWPSAGRADRRDCLILAEAVSKATLGQVVRRHFAQHLVAGQHADAVLAQLAGSVGNNHVVILQFDPKGRIGQQFGNNARKFEHVFFGHVGS